MAVTENRTTSKELYNFIFEACNILRGPVSQYNFKDYITPLLYYKRLSDVYDEETEEALAISGGDAEYAIFSRFGYSDDDCVEVIQKINALGQMFR